MQDGADRNALAGPIYVRLMELTVERGLGFVRTEADRVLQLLQKGKLSATKRRELEQRVNVLKAFESVDGDATDNNVELDDEL